MGSASQVSQSLDDVFGDGSYSPKLSRKQQNKIGLIVLLVSFSVYLIAIEWQIPTNYARNTFFYADYFVADQIVATGYVPADGAFEVTKYWGKINSKLKLPLLPAMLAVLQIVADVPFHSSFTFFPSVLLIAVSFFVLFKRMGVSRLTGIILAVVAGFAVPATPRYPIELYAAITGIMCLGVAVLQMKIDSPPSTGVNRIRHLVLLVIFMAFLFYWDPEKFFILSGILGITGIILFAQRERMLPYLILLVASGALFIQIFELPLRPYIVQLQSSILSFATLDFSNPLSAYAGGGGGGAEGGGGGQRRPYYSLLPLPVLLPLAAVGGIYTLRGINDPSERTSVIAVAWGIIALSLSVVFMIASAGWLAGRSYTFAVPVMILGCARFVKMMRKYLQYSVSVLLLVLVLSSVLLQLTVPLIHLHTYEPGIEDGADWASTHANSTVITDHKLGAPFAAKGDFDVMFPREDIEMTRGVFYSDDYTEFRRHADGPVLVAEGMKSYGVRAAGARGPIPDGVFDTITGRSNSVYSNGAVYYLLKN